MRKDVTLGVWKRYQTYDLEIAPSLAAAQHVFEHQGYRMEVRMPKKPREKDWRDEHAGLNCSGYKVRSGRKLPLSYTVNHVDTFLGTDDTRKVRADAIGKGNVALFPARERHRLDALAHKYEQILDSAFEHWVDVLRWKSGISTLCHLTWNRQRSAWGTYLIDFNDRRRFYAPPHVFVVEARNPVPRRAWTDAQSVLSMGAAVPLWHTYLADASHRLRLGDSRGFIIDLAIASETVVRRLTTKFLKAPVNPAFQAMANHVQISRLLDEWYRLGFDTPDWRRLNAERLLVKRVMELRNAVMHRGEQPKLTAESARQLREGVAKFVRNAERHFREHA